MTQLSFPLEQDYTVVVSSGSTVQAGDVLAHRIVPSEQVLNIADAMRISVKEVKKVLKKSIGDTVSEGDIIAEKKSFFGKTIAVLTSSLHGTVTKYDRQTGSITIETGQQTASNELISPVAGTVDLCNNKEIVVTTEHALRGVQSSSKNLGEGALFVLHESFQKSGNNILYYLDSSASGKVVFGGTITRDILVKGHGIGIAGVIATQIREGDMQYLQERKIALPVVIIEADIQDHLKKMEGKKIKVDAKNNLIIF